MAGGYISEGLIHAAHGQILNIGGESQFLFMWASGCLGVLTTGGCLFPEEVKERKRGKLAETILFIT